MIIVPQFKMKTTVIHILTLVGFILGGCREIQPEVELNYHSDSKRLSSILIPNDWHIEKEATYELSVIIFRLM